MTFPNYNSSLIFSVFTFFLFGCSSDAPPAAEENDNPATASINLYFDNIPDWDNSVEQAQPDELLDDIIAYEQTNIPYKCPAIRKNLVESQEKIISVGTNQGKIWPGALFEGNSLEPGDLRLITINRAPITINSDLVISNSFREIQNPNSVSVQQAIVEMQIEAGEMEEGNQAGAGQMNFRIEEASSFNQSMLSVGLSAGFTEPQSQVGLEASTNVSKNREARTHTVIARFVQEKFTVRLADDLIPTAADFFGEDVTLEDIESLESAGKIGTDNIPMYIESVTYGRILLFSMTSDSVSTASELSGALDASFADYVEGGGNIDNTQKKILENSTTKIYSAGGTEDGANAAIGSLDWSQFFVAAPVSTTVPISFTARTLNGNRVKVKINSNIFYEERQDCVEPIGYDITINLDRVELSSGICSNCYYTSYLHENQKNIPDVIDFGAIYLVWPGPFSGGSIKIFSDNPGGTGDDISFAITSGYCTTSALVLRACSIQEFINKNQKRYEWPYANLKTGAATKITRIVNAGLNKTIEFDYSIRKNPKWE